MANLEDNDVKIFDPSKKTEQPDDAIAFVEGMSHHRLNGNVDKAKELGVELALSIYDEDQSAKLSDEVFLSSEIFPQLCSLILFSTEAAFNYYLPSPQLSAIAINSLHEVMSRSNLPIYDEIMANQSFSFYFLSVRRGGENIAHDIGKAFAMLCNHKDDEKFVAEGERLYNCILNDVQQKITDMQFQN